MHLFSPGIFKPTVAGTYMLSAHVQARGTNNGPVRIKKNDDVICDMWIGQDGSFDLISCSTVAHLDLGDKVKVAGDSTDMAIIVLGAKNGFISLKVKDH